MSSAEARQGVTVMTGGSFERIGHVVRPAASGTLAQDGGQGRGTHTASLFSIAADRLRAGGEISTRMVRLSRAAMRVVVPLRM